MHRWPREHGGDEGWRASDSNHPPIYSPVRAKEPFLRDLSAILRGAFDECSGRRGRCARRTRAQKGRHVDGYSRRLAARTHPAKQGGSKTRGGGGARDPNAPPTTCSATAALHPRSWWWAPTHSAPHDCEACRPRSSRRLPTLALRRSTVGSRLFSCATVTPISPQLATLHPVPPPARTRHATRTSLSTHVAGRPPPSTPDRAR